MILTKEVLDKLPRTEPSKVVLLGMGLRGVAGLQSHVDARFTYLGNYKQERDYLDYLQVTELPNGDAYVTFRDMWDPAEVIISYASRIAARMIKLQTISQVEGRNTPDPSARVSLDFVYNNQVYSMCFSGMFPEVLSYVTMDTATQRPVDVRQTKQPLLDFTNTEIYAHNFGARKAPLRIIQRVETPIDLSGHVLVDSFGGSLSFTALDVILEERLLNNGH